ncbi:MULTISPECIES: DUF3293 domain-containing protein [unclassified Lebetimonas]|uniref:DUF3293 domain-containing protein n=1 Tax=unclassified Lebetimonas TaxID=2648158 RepID=UPI000464B902|nr:MULTISPECIES: DUF3293 domain-containing protein [unclassified Lebetimonas]
MRFNVIGIGDYKGKCIYDEAEDALMVDEEIVLDFKKKYKDYLKYTKFLINSISGRGWLSFQFIPDDYDVLKRKFAIITAHNPKGLILNDFLNFLKNTELEVILKTFGYEYFSSVGELFDHGEYSFIVYDIEKDDALNIAKEFDQHSFFYNSGEYISITECESKEDLLNYNYMIHFKGN